VVCLQDTNMLVSQHAGRPAAGCSSQQ